MTVIEDAVRTLQAERFTVPEALKVVPDRPGLYAVYGADDGWRQLGLEPDERPLYVGKAEDSLVNRDLRTHFATGRTGQSTVRRSFAALLAGPLSLRGVPRNLARPDGSAHFGLEPDGDQRLTEWMREHLRLAVWPKPDGVVLADVETAVLARWQPPLNLMKVSHPWPALKEARARMAAQAREWRPHDGRS